MTSISPPQKIGLILPASLTYARQILEGVSSWVHEDPGLALSFLSESGAPPPIEDIPADLAGVIYFPWGNGWDENVLSHLPKVNTSNRQLREGEFQVVSDDVEVGRMGAEYFLRRGYRELIYVHRHGHRYAEERKQGFLARAKEAGLEVEVLDSFVPGFEVHLRKTFASLTHRYGVFAANDNVARVVLELMEDVHARVPFRFSVLGVDNDALHRSLSPIPLSTIALDGQRVGRLAVDLLLEQFQYPDRPPRIVRVPPRRVITRQSSDLYAQEDPMVVRILETMDAHLSELQSISDLAAKLNLPRRNMEIRFRKATGTSPAAQLTLLRVERARELLRDTEMSQAEIAEDVGYSEARMLWLNFKKHYGESPSAFRKRIEGHR